MSLSLRNAALGLALFAVAESGRIQPAHAGTDHCDPFPSDLVLQVGPSNPHPKNPNFQFSPLSVVAGNDQLGDIDPHSLRLVHDVRGRVDALVSVVQHGKSEKHIAVGSVTVDGPSTRFTGDDVMPCATDLRDQLLKAGLLDE